MGDDEAIQLDRRGALRASRDDNYFEDAPWTAMNVVPIGYRGIKPLLQVQPPMRSQLVMSAAARTQQVLRGGNRSHAGFHVQLRPDVFDMFTRRSHCNSEDGRDLPVLLRAGEPVQHLAFPTGKTTSLR